MIRIPCQNPLRTDLFVPRTSNEGLVKPYSTRSRTVLYAYACVRTVREVITSTGYCGRVVAQALWRAKEQNPIRRTSPLPIVFRHLLQALRLHHTSVAGMRKMPRPAYVATDGKWLDATSRVLRRYLKRRYSVYYLTTFNLQLRN